MTRSIVALGLTGAFLVGVIACDSNQHSGEAKKEEGVTQESAEHKPAAMEATMKEEAGAGEESALMAPEGSPAQKENDEGVNQYGQGHHDVAEEHFLKAIAADAKLAEAHFNLALTLDKLGKHGEATEHFTKAAELAHDNPKITDSMILKKHIGH